jgi:hypothetical protein
MWIVKYVVCLIQHHDWVGSRYHYCLRCGKLAIGVAESHESMTLRNDAN